LKVTFLALRLSLPLSDLEPVAEILEPVEGVEATIARSSLAPFRDPLKGRNILAVEGIQSKPGW
jgi:hypothetical protein